MASFHQTVDTELKNYLIVFVAALLAGSDVGVT